MDGFNNLKTCRYQIRCLQTQDIEKISYGLRNKIFKMENSGNTGLRNNNAMKKN
jgi:hypothetical protein